jgi:SAM-dependent methyltransferase
MDILSDLIGRKLGGYAKVLDVGCGDGKIDSLIMQKSERQFGRGCLEIFGVDVLVRDATYIPVLEFDGNVLPFKDDEFDAVTFIDVLHHIDDPINILFEAKRVSKNAIIIKDHFREGLFAKSTLKFMDYVGNAHYGVRLPYNYMTKGEWEGLFVKLGMSVKGLDTKLHLYKFPFSLIFDRKLHFIASLQENEEAYQ